MLALRRLVTLRNQALLPLPLCALLQPKLPGGALEGPQKELRTGGFGAGKRTFHSRTVRRPGHYLGVHFRFYPLPNASQKWNDKVFAGGLDRRSTRSVQKCPSGLPEAGRLACRIHRPRPDTQKRGQGTTAG